MLLLAVPVITDWSTLRLYQAGLELPLASGIACSVGRNRRGERRALVAGGSFCKSLLAIRAVLRKHCLLSLCVCWLCLRCAAACGHQPELANGSTTSLPHGTSPPDHAHHFPNPLHCKTLQSARLPSMHIPSSLTHLCVMSSEEANTMLLVPASWCSSPTRASGLCWAGTTSRQWASCCGTA